MSWAEVKYALNSTVGTDEFKPLDELMKDEVNLMRYDGKRFAVDDTIIETKTGGGKSTVPTNTVTGNVVDICSVRPKIGGTWTVQTPVTTYMSFANETTLYASVLVYVNDVYYGKGTFTHPSTSSGQKSGTASMNVSFKAGDKISFKFQTTLSISVESGSFYASCSSVNILAKVVDNLIEDL